MNKVILIGRLTRDPFIFRNSETSVTAKYTLAVDRRFKKSEEGPTADFISCVAFGKTADFVEKFLKKGTKIAITGRIQTGEYTNKEGQRVFTTDVVVEDHEFCEGRNANPEDGAGKKERKKQEKSADDYASFMGDGDVDDSELPF